MFPEQYSCLVDMDGVLTDFQSAMESALEVKKEELEYKLGCWETVRVAAAKARISEEEAWKIMDDESFWSQMDWMPDGYSLLKVVEKYFKPEQIYICTSPAGAHSAAGKVRWLEKNLPQYAGRFVLTKHKYLMASQQNILIDDSDTNIRLFTYKGGRPILVPRFWNRAHNDSARTVDSVDGNLSLELDDLIR